MTAGVVESLDENTNKIKSAHAHYSYQPVVNIVNCLVVPEYDSYRHTTNGYHLFEKEHLGKDACE